MALTDLQNCQRGIIFLVFLNILIFFVFLTIKLIKKQVDPADASSKYAEGNKEKDKEQTKAKAEESNIAFDQHAIKPPEPAEELSTVQKILKQIYELEMFYMPLLIVFPLNLVTGTSKAFAIVDYFFIVFCLLAFNLFKIHRKCVQHKVIRVFLQTLWLLFVFFMLLNEWTTGVAWMPYVISNRA